MKTFNLKYDICVIGGGMSGICAAIAAARMGKKVALLQDRPVLGGNASSEIRMHICGASRAGERSNLRETGIIEEILLENKARNPEHSYGIFDSVLWEKVKNEENIDLYLNCYALDVEVDGRMIKCVTAIQTTTEKTYIISAEEFIDCSGDGAISAKAGATYMFGRESKDVFGEPGAVEKSDTVTMGNSILFRSLDAGHSVDFTRPEWAYDYSDAEWTKKQKWVEITSGYWWIEIGGTEWNVVEDAELTRDEMLKIIFGIWDYIKNHSVRKDEVANYYLDWVSFIPAKRESRRFVGDYVLKEQDVLENKMFDDAIAYGGWHIDTHRPEGFYAFIYDKPYNGDETIVYDGIYTIPYRCIYSKDFDNLFFGGRIISASHRAFASTRVMGTCSIVAQAAGIAAAMAVSTGEVASSINVKELQQKLLKEDCYIPNVFSEDNDDYAKKAIITASSEEEYAVNVINGISRTVNNDSNMWESKSDDKEPWITLKWDKEIAVNEVRITFDSDLSKELTISLSKWVQNKQLSTLPSTLVRDYSVLFKRNNKVVAEKCIRNNCRRLNVIQSEMLICDEITIKLNSLPTPNVARIFEIRVY